MVWRSILPSVRWAVLGRALWMLGVLGLCVGCSISTNYSATPENMYADFSGTSPTAPADSLRIASYNIYLGQDMDLALADLRRNPSLAMADILLLQEVDPQGASDLAQALDMSYVYWPSFELKRTERLFGNAVLSRWPIVDQAAVELPHRNPFVGLERVVVAADIQINGGGLRVVCVHFSTVSVAQDKRLEQVRTVLDSLTNVDGPVIVAGDFNAVSKSDQIQMRRLMRKAGYKQMRLPAGPTASSSVLDFTGYDLVLDYIFYKDLVAGSGGVERQAEASDHYPIWGTFVWP